MADSRRFFLKQLGLISGGLLAQPLLDGSLMALPNSSGKAPNQAIPKLTAQKVESYFYPLYSVENPVGPSPLALQAINEIPTEFSHRYGMQDFFEGELKKELSKTMGVPVDHLFLKPGSTETLRMITRSLSTQEKPILMSSHDYGFLFSFAREYNSRIKLVPVSDDLNVDLEALAANSKGVGFVYLSNPHMPLSGVHTPVEIEKLIKKVHPTPVVVDECYINYLGKGFEKQSCAPLVTRYSNLIVTRTFSKSHALAALRIGYHAVSKVLWKKLDLQTREMSPISVAAAIGSLNDPTYWNKVEKHCEKARKVMGDFGDKNGLGYRSVGPYLIFTTTQMTAAKSNKLVRRGITFQPVVTKNKKPIWYTMVTLARDKEVEAYLYDMKQGLS